MEQRDSRHGADGGAEGQRDGPISGSVEELCELGGRLLEEGDARRAAEVFSAAAAGRDGKAADRGNHSNDAGRDAEGSAAGQDADGREAGRGVDGQDADGGEAGRSADGREADRDDEGEDPADPVRGRALAGLGIARLEQALAAFKEAAEWAGPDVRPLAVELLARALPLRDRDAEAAQAWRWGLDDPDPEVAGAVHARLRRSFEAGAGTGGSRPWWEGFLESAVCHGTLPLLAGELFAALDHMYAVVAVSYTRSGNPGRELHDALAEAVRLPGGYAWGAELQESFRRRLRDEMGADADVVPPG